MNNSISVIIPTHNRAHTLQRALDSVICQHHQPHEIIIIDDGSTDETQTLIKEKYPTAHYIKQNNRGVSHARNQGIRAASSEWIALLDSDDQWHPHKLERQIQALNTQPQYKLCHTNETWFRHGKFVNPMKKHKKHGGWVYTHCLPLCCISPSSVLIHRSLFDTVGVFDENLPACEDYDLWLRICAIQPVLYLDEPLTIKYGGHADQLSKKYWGMDRFRLQALVNIIKSNTLNNDQYNATIEMIKHKAKILKQGAEKYNNSEIKKFIQQQTDSVL